MDFLYKHFDKIWIASAVSVLAFWIVVLLIAIFAIVSFS